MQNSACRNFQIKCNACALSHLFLYLCFPFIHFLSHLLNHLFIPYLLDKWLPNGYYMARCMYTNIPQTTIFYCVPQFIFVCLFVLTKVWLNAVLPRASCRSFQDKWAAFTLLPCGNSTTLRPWVIHCISCWTKTFLFTFASSHWDTDP